MVRDQTSKNENVPPKKQFLDTYLGLKTNDPSLFITIKRRRVGMD